MSTAATPANRWLFGPVPDLLIGCGVGYMAIFAVLLLAGPGFRGWIPLGLLPVISVFAGTPHYGATLLRVYEQRRERRAYAFFAVYVTALLWALYYAGLYSAAVGTLLLTVYLTWSPWHYSGQNYGIALLFLRRRGIDVTPGTKRLIYASFVLSYLLTFLAIHGAVPGADYAPIDAYSGSIYDFRRLGIPALWWYGAFAGVGLAYLATLGAAGAVLLRRARPSDLLPSALVALTQLLWFSLPPLGRELGLLRGLDPFAPQNAAYVFVWVGAGHAFQYLWVTTYYAQGSAPRSARLRYYLKCICAGSAIWSLPALAYSWSGLEGSALGGVATGADAGVLIAAAVNLHHFVLDGAIWKLRDGRVARILIRREPELATSGAPIGPRRMRWLEPALLGAGALWTLSTITALVVGEYGVRRPVERGDLRTAWHWTDRLAAIRRAGANEYVSLARSAHRIGNDRVAQQIYDVSLARWPSASTWLEKGMMLEASAGAAAATAAYESGLSVDPGNVELLYRLGLARLKLQQPEAALDPLERARALAPDRKGIELSLDRARRLASPAQRGTL
jgi:tetratricopeptide (TPR) repeat protein